ncbi:MAG: hypothetical protein P4L69_13530 [Desulfosporosinus sp.]|nr:hypothetical protein [Desulfosporosinus sp.]
MYEQRSIINENLLRYIRAKGYSKRSFALLINIERQILDSFISGDLKQTEYESCLKFITNALQKPFDYFLHLPKIQLESWQLQDNHYIKIDGYIETNLSQNEWLDQFTDWLESRNEYFGGNTKP